MIDAKTICDALKSQDVIDEYTIIGDKIWVKRIFADENSNIISLPIQLTVCDDISINFSKFNTLKNFPLNVDKNVNLGYCASIKTLQYLPQVIGKTLFVPSIGVDNPYEFRYLFYSDIQNVMGLPPNIDKIYLQYRNKPEYYHLAIEALMTLGERLGFNY